MLATTLMEIKTRMLLPRPELGEDAQEAFDPRAELVRQLLEYKAFKDAAGELRSAAAAQAMRFARRPAQLDGDEAGKDLEEVQLWDLVEAFSRLMTAIGQNVRETHIIYDDTPIELHAEDILDRLRREGNMAFADIFAGRTARTELVGLFLALLELARRRSIYIEQREAFGEIHVFLNPDPAPPQANDLASEADSPDDPAGDAAAGPATAATPPAAAQAPSQQDGQYQPSEQPDERRSQTPPDGP